jgi:coenzyme F420-0:L-glutamate ligase/coenzyme F420-1:gamma-L-glutamate ligase
LQEFYELIAERRSIRQFQKTAISQGQLRRILEVCTWAPSAHNAQPWRFFVLQDAKSKTKLAKAMGQIFRQDLEADREEARLIEDLVQGSVDRFSSAPVLVLACLTMDSMDVYPDEKRQQAEHIMAVQSVAAALQTLLLAAHAEGLGACWYCAPLFCPETIKQALELSEEIVPQALLILGEPDETPDAPLRHAFEDVVTFIDETED